MINTKTKDQERIDFDVAPAELSSPSFLLCLLKPTNRVNTVVSSAHFQLNDSAMLPLRVQAEL